MAQDREAEPRSFGSPARRSMGELTPIDVEALSPDELSKAAVRGVVQVHACLEQHILEQTKVNAASTLADLAIREDLQKLTLAFGLRKPEEGEKPPKAVIKIPWVERVKTVATLGASIAGLAALYKLGVAMWPTLSAYLLALK